MDTAIKYQYQPLLESDAIRLLELKPSLDINAQVECSLISSTFRACNHDLIEHYTALSYVWGDAQEQKTILVDGRALSITVNLDTALRHLRDPTRKRLIWADAICINQSNSREKNHQVVQMAKIYQDALHTIIFLGESTPESNLVMDTLRDATYEILSSENIGDLPWDSLFNRPWFTRVWVFQELTLSRDPWVQCGEKRVRWHRLLETAAWLPTSVFSTDILETIFHMDEERKRITENAWRSHLHITETAGREIVIRSGVEEQIDRVLLNILSTRQGFGVSDPRDMLFAHLQCLRVGLGSSELHPLLRVDYGKTAAEVYSNIAKYFIFTHGSLRILSHTERTLGRGQQILDLPSWCPNWTAKRPPSCYCTLESLHTKLSRKKDNDDFDFYPPSFSERFGLGSFTFWPSQSLMACVGINFGPIKQVSESLADKLASFTFNCIDFMDREASQELGLWDDLIRSGTEFYEYWNDLLGPIFAQAEHVPLELSSPYGCWSIDERFRDCKWPNFLAYIIRHCNLLVQESLLLKISDTYKRGCLNKGAGIIEHLFQYATLGNSKPQILFARKIALLDSGKLVLVPETVRPGDIVVRFIDDPLAPYILRPRSPSQEQKAAIKREVHGRFHVRYNRSSYMNMNHFDFVGECFIYDSDKWWEEITDEWISRSMYQVFVMH